MMARAGDVRYQSQAGTNETFAQELCAAISSALGSDTSLDTIAIAGSGGGVFFELPDCFWNSISSASSFNLAGIILRGVSTGARGARGQVSVGMENPFARFPTTLQTFTLVSSVLVDPTQTSYVADLEPIASWTQLADLQMIGLDLGGATLPSRAPASSSFIIDSCNLTGTIPSMIFAAVIPSRISFAHNALTGSIPLVFSGTATLPASTLVFDVRDNQLSGSLPAELFNNGFFQLTQLYFTAQGNRLTGSLPDGFLPPMGQFAILTVDVSDNQLSGSVPIGFATTNFLTQANANSLSQISLLAGNNSLSGIVPSFWSNLEPSNVRISFRLDLSNNQFSSVSLGIIPNASWTMDDTQTAGVPTISLNLTSNLIQGTIPAGLIDNNAPTLYVGLSNNLLTGTVPEDFMSNIPFSVNLALSLANNDLSGTLPTRFFSGTSRSSFDFDISHNPSLGGAIPSQLGDVLGSSFLSGSTYVNMSHCAFSGSMPRLLLSVRLSSAVLNFESNQLTTASSGAFNLSSFLFPNSGPNYQLTYFSLNIADNKFTGVLDVTGLPSGMDSNNFNVNGFRLNASSNGWTSAVIDDSWSPIVNSLDISHSPKLISADFSSNLFGVSRLRTLYASNTNLTGPFPNLGAQLSYIVSLDFSNNSNIDFCGQRASWASSYLTTCLLTNTNANVCPDLYPASCHFSPLPPPITPVTPPTPTSPTTSPSSSQPETSGPSGTPSGTPSGSPFDEFPIAPSSPIASSSPTPHSVPTGHANRNLVSTAGSAMCIALIALSAFM